MIGTILVPLDGSAFAETALRPACVLARSLQADLQILKVAEPPLGAAMSHYTHGGTAWLQAVDQAQEYLERTATPLRADGQRVELRVEIGPPPDAIAAVANELAAGIVVMATHGRGALSRLVVGSVASEALRKLAVPVCLIRPHAVDDEAAVEVSGARRPADAAAPACRRGQRLPREGERP